MSDQQRIITVRDIANCVYCSRAWLLSVVGERDDPEIDRLAQMVALSRAAEPGAAAPTSLFDDLGRTTILEKKPGCSLILVVLLGLLGLVWIIVSVLP